MKFYNLSIDIRQQKCVVVGGGKVALRKARKLSLSGADVTLIALEFLPEFYQDDLLSQLNLVQSGYSKNYLEGATLVFAATSSFEVNQEVCRDANALGIWVNSVNGVEYGTFTIPASCNKGVLTLSITTEGQVPILSKELRKYFQSKIENVSTDLLEELIGLRKAMVSEQDIERKKSIESVLKNITKQLISQIDNAKV